MSDISEVSPVDVKRVDYLQSELLYKPGRGISTSAAEEVGHLLGESYRTERQVLATSRIIRTLSETPWTTQAELLQETGLTVEEMIQLNEGIRGSPSLQDLMVKRGLGTKYWNTMLPLVQVGAVDRVLDHEYGFPVRLGVYPGLSCMFKCSFCGRNEDAKYSSDTVTPGNEMFREIFRDMPKENTTVSFSGGLEPLTNSRIGELITAAKESGIRWVPLITNGYALSEALVARQPGIFNANSIRVSLYGIDSESYKRVTGKDAYERVKGNVTSFLRARNERAPKLQVGFNYILLPGTSDHPEKIVDLVAEINSAVENGPGVNFLTLRDDFGSVSGSEGVDQKSQGTNEFITQEEREALIAGISRFKEKRAALTPSLKVDFGYAIHSLERGVLGRPLTKVPDSEIRRHAYPQVSIVVDMHGDVFLFREAGFLDRPGNEQFIAGRVTPERPLEDILRSFVEEKRELPLNGSGNYARYMDSSEDLTTRLINQAEADRATGIPFEKGPVKDRVVKDKSINKDGTAFFSSVHQ